MQTQIRQIGNSLGSIIPAAFIRQLGLAEGAKIDIKTKGNQIIIEPCKPTKKRFPFSENELLNGLNAYSAHADELAIISEEEVGE